MGDQLAEKFRNSSDFQTVWPPSDVAKCDEVEKMSAKIPTDHGSLSSGLTTRLNVYSNGGKFGQTLAPHFFDRAGFLQDGTRM